MDDPCQARGEPIFKLNFVHVITPASPMETHYFYAVTRNVRREDDELSVMLLAQNGVVRSKDVTALEASKKSLINTGTWAKKSRSSPTRARS